MAKLPERLIKNRDLYEEYRSKRLKEGKLAIDGLYGVMLAIKASEPITVFLEATVTGHGPGSLHNQFIYLRMFNRENEPKSVHISIADGTFDSFDTSILVKKQLSRPQIEEGYLLAPSAELIKRLSSEDGTV